MAKKSAIENNKRKMRLVKQFANRRTKLKAIANNDSLPMEERFEARFIFVQGLAGDCRVK